MKGLKKTSFNNQSARESSMKSSHSSLEKVIGKFPNSSLDRQRIMGRSFASAFLFVRASWKFLTALSTESLSITQNIHASFSASFPISFSISLRLLNDNLKPWNPSSYYTITICFYSNVIWRKNIFTEWGKLVIHTKNILSEHIDITRDNKPAYPTHSV